MENNGITNEGLIAAMSVLAAAIAMFPAALTGFAQGKATAAAVEAVGRQPEAGKEVRSTMIMGLALAESSGIYGLVVAILILMVRPFS